MHVCWLWYFNCLLLAFIRWWIQLIMWYINTMNTQFKFNSSPIDELGDGACQSGRWFWGEQRALSHEPWAGHTGIHGNSASGNHPPGTVTLTQSVEILTNPILTQIHQWGREGKGEKSETTERNAAWNKQHLTEQKRTTHAIQETPYNTSMRMTPRPPLTSIGLILT